MKTNDFIKTAILLIYIIVITWLLFGCDKERNCKTWSCKTWDSEGNVEWIDVFSPNHQLYTDCNCVDYFKTNWK